MYAPPRFGANANGVTVPIGCSTSAYVFLNEPFCQSTSAGALRERRQQKYKMVAITTAPTPPMTAPTMTPKFEWPSFPELLPSDTSAPAVGEAPLLPSSPLALLVLALLPSVLLVPIVPALLLIALLPMPRSEPEGRVAAAVVVLLEEAVERIPSAVVVVDVVPAEIGLCSCLDNENKKYACKHSRMSSAPRC